MTRILILSLTVAGCLVLLAGTLYRVQRRLIYVGAGSGATAGPVPGTQVVAVATPDGERLHALWRAPRPGCGVVLTFHGNASAPEFHAARFAGAPWAEHGWGVLAIAYRGYPGSTGSPGEDGLIADGLAAAEEAARRAPGAAVILHGHSLGAAVAVAVAERVAHAGLYLEAPFDSLVHLVRLILPGVPTALLRDPWRSDRRIAAEGPPVLVVHGVDDAVVPAKLGVRLAAAAGPRARFEGIAGDHDSVFGARDAEAEALFRPAVGAGCARAG